MKKGLLALSVIAVGFLFVQCSGSTRTTTVQRPHFDSDSAYLYVARQLAFGPRVPNSEAHTRCMLWIGEELKRHHFDVQYQSGVLPNYAGKGQVLINIIATYKGSDTIPSVLLAAHYDTRPWTDNEAEYENRFTPVIGANDGASGVAVLLEVARQIDAYNEAGIKGQPVTLVFFDLEDSGTPAFFTGVQREDTWCLGSQWWAANNHQAIQYGIVLDMVGAPDAQFPKEYYSAQYAENYQEKIWRKAASLGYGRLFVQDYTMPITDDHYYVNLSGIPCVDIIHYDAHTQTGFADWWHTQKDNLQHIDKATLQAVGEVILSCLNY